MDWRDKIVEQLNKEAASDDVKLVNLTPHDIHYKSGGETIALSPSGTVARVNQVQKNVGSVAGLPVNYTEYGDVDGLPEFDPNGKVYYVVSTIVAQALSEKSARNDYIVPDSGPSAERDEGGRLSAINGWIVYSTRWSIT